MPFSRDSLQIIVDRIIADFQTRITGAASLLRRSTLNVVSKVNAGAFHLLYEYLDYQARQLFVSTADEAGLDAHAFEYGLSRRTAVVATGITLVTGITGIIIPAGSELQSIVENVYTTDVEVTISNGQADLSVTAAVPGSDSNDDSGIILTFISPIVGVNTSTVVNSDGLVNGKDEEFDNELRDRILLRKRQPPYGGTETDFLNWTLEYPGVTRAWIFPIYHGPGTVGVAFVRDNDISIIPNAEKRQEVYDYLVEHEHEWSGIIGIPVTAEPGLFIIELSALAVDLDISLDPNTDTVRAAVELELQGLFERDGGPGETMAISSIAEAISLAEGEKHHRLNSPIINVIASKIQIHILGTITWRDY